LEITMTSTAISAQGSTLKVGTGSGAAKTVTGVAVGFPTIVTSAAHGMSNGDVIALAALTGADAASLNGLSVTLSNVTANTFAVDVDTTGKTITAGAGTATPVSWTQVNNWKTYNGFDGQASEIDVTNLSSTAKEIRLGLVDFGNLTIEVDHDESDPGQAALLAAYNASTSRTFKVTLPNSNTATFTAYVRKFGVQGGVDQVVKRQIELRISGSVAWA
jgi:hypothetical protein